MNMPIFIALAVLAYLGLRKSSGTSGLNGLNETRPSCPICVQKHLGSACVILAEMRDGYDAPGNMHPMLFVGHLNEAADEAQQWPALHNAIREARIAWQMKRIEPDFEKLCAMVEAIKVR